MIKNNKNPPKMKDLKQGLGNPPKDYKKNKSIGIFACVTPSTQ